MLHTLTHGENVRVGSFHVIVDHDAAFHFQASFMGESDVGANARGNHDKISRDAASTLEFDTIDLFVP